MPTLKLHYDGWLLLPAALRRQLGLNSGDRLDVQLVDGTIVLRPAARAKRSVEHRGSGRGDRPPCPGYSWKRGTAGCSTDPSRPRSATQTPGWCRCRFTGAQAATWSAKADPCADGRTTACAYGQQRTMEAAAQGRSAAAGGACRACSAAEPPALSDAQRSRLAGRRATPVPQCRGAQARATAPAQRVSGIVPDRTQSGRPSAHCRFTPGYRSRFGRDAWNPGVRVDAPTASGAFCLATESKGMSKSELIKRLAIAHPHLHLRHIELIVDTVFEQIGAALARGARVELRGFGAFSTRARGARLGRNPRTGSRWPCRARPCCTSKPAKSCSSASTRSTEQRSSSLPLPFTRKSSGWMPIKRPTGDECKLLQMRALARCLMLPSRAFWPWNLRRLGNVGQ